MEAYKSGQGSLTRMLTVSTVLVLLVLGCRELYSWIYDPKDSPIIPLDVFESLPLLGVPLSWTFLICVAIFVIGVFLFRKYLTKPSTVDTLIETEAEMKKVAWPTMEESKSATMIVILVTGVITATLALFDTVLSRMFQLVF
jgi:preprotein translocase SecE subunit